MNINILKLAIEAQFKPSLTFYGKQGEIGNQIWEKVYPDWETDGKRIIFKNTDNKEISFIEFRRVLVIKENLGAYKKEMIPSQNFSHVFKSYSKVVTDCSLLRLGFRVIGFYDCKMKFSEIVSIMEPKVYPAKGSKLYEITSTKFDDVAFTVVYKKDNKSIRFQCGPVTREELLSRAQLGFPPEKELPNASLFFDIDVFKLKPLATEVDQFVNESTTLLEKDIHDFLTFIFE